MPPASASVLNPHAPSFHPRYDEPLDFTSVFTDGVPTAVLSGDVHPEHEAIRNVPDDAIDEAFPPSADEAAELDAVMDFVLTMSYIEVMEEQEERARSDFECVGRRWEARRGEGLRGRPNPPRSRPPDLVASNHRKISAETAIVPFDKSQGPHRPYSDMEHARSREVGRHHSKHGAAAAIPKKKAVNGYSRPIQQPRKQFR